MEVLSPAFWTAWDSLKLPTGPLNSSDQWKTSLCTKLRRPHLFVGLKLNSSDH
jgi:hypothetical protein